MHYIFAQFEAETVKARTRGMQAEDEVLAQYRLIKAQEYSMLLHTRFDSGTASKSLNFLGYHCCSLPFVLTVPGI